MYDIDTFTCKVNNRFTRLDSPDTARGMCADVSEFLRDEFGLPLIRVIHDNDPDYRYKAFDQHSDHYASVLPDGRMLDYTLRQFDRNTPYPFIGTRKEWEGILSRAWDSPAIEDTPCDRCGFYDDVCFCCLHCDDDFCVCY